MHYDGSEWSVEWQGGGGATESLGLQTVSGASADSVFAVGDWIQYPTPASPTAGGVVMQKKDGAWNITANYEDPCAFPPLAAVWASSASDVFAAGGPYLSGACLEYLVMHYDGRSWSQMTLPPGTNGTISGLWGTSPSDVFAVGTADLSGFVLHYDGATWSANTSVYSNGFTGIWGASPSDVFAVGESYDGVGDYFDEIIHYDGSSWSLSWWGLPGQLIGIWGVAR